MLNETYRGMLAHKSVIRETFMYGCLLYTSPSPRD